MGSIKPSTLDQLEFYTSVIEKSGSEDILFMDSKIVTVVVPAYNAERYMRKAIESILAQTYRSFEIIVVDDGSTDATALIAQQFCNDVHYIHQNNRGLAAARNAGIRYSQAQIIALLDADDLWEPTFLEVMVDLLNRHPKAAGAYCGFQYIDERGCAIGKPSLKVVSPEKFHEGLMTNGNWLSACGVLFRRELAEHVGLFDESLRAVEDEDLWIRLSERWLFVGVPEALVKYRRHDTNMSNDPERIVTAILQVRNKLFGPADGDAETWSASKRRAYRSTFQMAAIRYLAAGQIQKSADFLLKLAGISWDYLYSVNLWRGLARASIPEVYQFDPLAKPDMDVAETHVMALLAELAGRIANSIPLRRQYARIKSSAFLAMADEAGRSRKSAWAFSWLWKAVFINPRLIFARPYWGTIARSFSLIKSV